jgi:hypothetical protein
MRVIGWLATLTGIALLAGTVLVIVQSIPDIQRYLRIRSM